MGDRKKEAMRIARIRNKKVQSDEEKAQVAAWDANKKTSGRPRKDPSDVRPIALIPEIIPVDPELNSAAASDGESSGAPPPDPPPRPDFSAGDSPGSRKGKGGGDWRDKYRQSGSGRESACVQLAHYYCSWILTMNKAIEEMGGAPVMDMEGVRTFLFPAAVLTADKFGPGNMELTPEMTVVAVTAATATKRVYYGWKTNRDNQEAKQKERQAASRIRPEQPQARETAPQPEVVQEGQTAVTPSNQPSKANGREYKVKPGDPI